MKHPNYWQTLASHLPEKKLLLDGVSVTHIQMDSHSIKSTGISGIFT